MKPSEIKLALSHLIEQRRPVMVWGPPGAGKSAVMAQVAKNLNLELHDVRLSTMDVVDVRGFPVPDMEAKVMKWLTANFLPPMLIKGKPNKTRGVLFLDELNSAVPAVQAAMYQLMLDFKIGDYTLPEGWSLVAAGNRKTDRSVVHDMPSALRNRLVHIDYELNADDWDDWARAEGLPSVLRGFLRFRPALLHSPHHDDAAWPSGRTWEFVGRNIYNKGLPAGIEAELIKGTVGAGAATEFLAYVPIANKVPKVEDIMKSPATIKIDTDDPALMYATATMLDTHITPKTIEKALKFVDRLPAEYAVLTMRGAARACDSLVSTPEMITWLNKHQDLLIG